MASMHEELVRTERLEPGSNRAFGLVMAGACLVIAAAKLWFGAASWWLWVFVAAAFAGAAWLAPRMLAPLNRLWFRFGLLLHRIVSPLTMAVVFFGVMLPTGLLMRLFGVAPLATGFDRTAATYWRARPPGRPTAMTKQH